MPAPITMNAFGAAAAAAFPFVERQFFDVGNEIGFPYPSLVKLGLGGEIVRSARIAIGEIVGIVKNKIFARPLAQQLRQIGDGKPARRARQAGVKKLMRTRWSAARSSCPVPTQRFV